jgi:DNA sulfur modification protein DndD
VLVLSTDTEVDRQLAHQLNGAVASTYRLDHDDETLATEIVPGYFFDGIVAA